MATVTRDVRTIRNDWRPRPRASADLLDASRESRGAILLKFGGSGSTWHIRTKHLATDVRARLATRPQIPSEAWTIMDTDDVISRFMNVPEESVIPLDGETRTFLQTRGLAADLVSFASGIREHFAVSGKIACKVAQDPETGEEYIVAHATVRGKTADIVASEFKFNTAVVERIPVDRLQLLRLAYRVRL
jgi:hypothetical protein